MLVGVEEEMLVVGIILRYGWTVNLEWYNRC